VELACRQSSTTMTKVPLWRKIHHRLPQALPTSRRSPRTYSDQANAKGLHGKERKKFRAKC
jgi:hypothetical protein